MPRITARSNLGKRVLIKIDGVVVGAAQSCDTDEGWIEMVARDKKGRVLFRKVSKKDCEPRTSIVYKDFQVHDRITDEILYDVK